MSNRDNDYKHLFRDDESLSVFLRAMKRFDRVFCDAMAEGREYTLRLEVHGAGGNMIHARVFNDEYDRPRGKHKTPRLQKTV